MKQRKIGHRVRVTQLSCGAMLVGFATGAGAFEFNTGNPDFSLRLDSTVKYSAAARLHAKDSSLSKTQTGRSGVIGPNNLNQDDGDNNFSRGLVSNRFDILSEADLIWNNFGARVSAAGWYDDVYNRNNDNSTLTSNSIPANHFPEGTQDAMGQGGEILDAFVFGKGNIGGHAASFRAGRHTLLWGESLFYGINGIAGGQAPIDLVKASSVPNSQFKEIALPTGKVSGQIRVTDNITLGAYVGYEWRESRLLPVGSYLSTSDVLGPGSERLLAPPLGVFKEQNDRKPSDWGQGGLQLRWSDPDSGADYGVYAIRFNPTTPANIWTKLNVGPTGLQPDYYQWVYHEGTEAVGASATKNIGDWSFAGEISARDNMPLSSIGLRIIPAFNIGTGFDNTSHPGYAVGRTAHAQFSWTAALGPSFISNEAVFLGEIAWNRVMSVQDNEDMINPNTDRSAQAIKMVYTPTYRQVFSGVDLSPSVGASYGVGASRALGPAFSVDHGGEVNVGISGVYLNTWTGTLTYTTYYGPTGSTLDNNSNAQFKQALKDRDYISFSLRTTF